MSKNRNNSSNYAPQTPSLPTPESGCIELSYESEGPCIPGPYQEPVPIEVAALDHDSREIDMPSDLQDKHVRRYDTGTGRWSSQDPLEFCAENGNFYQYVNDRLANATKAETDSAFVPETDVDHEPGLREFLGAGESFRERYFWTGRELDAETGLEYQRVRFFDPTQGQFLEDDK